VFFYMSKILWVATDPVNATVFASMLGALLLFTGRWRGARRLVLAGIVGLAVLGFSPVPKLLLRPLEERLPRPPDDSRPVAGLVVLGGIGWSRGEVTLSSTGTRILAGIRLAHKHPHSLVVFSGGNPEIGGSEGETEARAAAMLLAAAEIARDRVVLEHRSRNTWENALFTRDLVRTRAGQRWLLVTSAFHMPRAIGAFRAVGLELEPHPVDFRTEREPGTDLVPFGHAADGLALAGIAIREWVGLAVYYLAGYTDEYLPAPRR
jgi:uncharacterized SAM-binding protein YcdF (DUF218 family)